MAQVLSSNSLYSLRKARRAGTITANELAVLRAADAAARRAQRGVAASRKEQAAIVAAYEADVARRETEEAAAAAELEAEVAEFAAEIKETRRAYVRDMIRRIRERRQRESVEEIIVKAIEEVRELAEYPKKLVIRETTGGETVRTITMAGKRLVISFLLGLLSAIRGTDDKSEFYPDYEFSGLAANIKSITIENLTEADEERREKMRTKHRGAFFPRVVSGWALSNHCDNTEEVDAFVNFLTNKLRIFVVGDRESWSIVRAENAVDGADKKMSCFYHAVCNAAEPQLSESQKVSFWNIVVVAATIGEGMSVEASAIRSILETLFKTTGVCIDVQLSREIKRPSGELNYKINKYTGCDIDRSLLNLNRTVSKIRLVGNHYIPDIDLPFPVLISRLVCIGLKQNVKSLGGKRNGHSTDRRRPLTAAHDLVRWFTTDEAIECGIVREIDDEHCRLVNADYESMVGRIDDRTLANDDAMKSMCRLIIDEEKDDDNKPKREIRAVFVIDFEAYSRSSDGVQVAYMAQWGELNEVAGGGSKAVTVEHGKDAGVEFFRMVAKCYSQLPKRKSSKKKPSGGDGADDDKLYRKLREKPTLIYAYAHNSKYDCSMWVQAGKLAGGWTLSKRLTNNGSPVFVEMKHAKANVAIRLVDSYRVLMTKVADLPTMWGFAGDIEKEMMLHDVVADSEDTIDPQTGCLTDSMSEDELRKRVASVNAHEYNAQAQFDADAWVAKFDAEGFRNASDGSLQFRRYVEKYGRGDVVIVARALLAYDAMFDKLVKESGIKIEHPELLAKPSQSFSTSSIGDSWYKATGCFDGCYETSGVLNLYLQSFVLGGRCQVQSQRQGAGPFTINAPVQVMDARSLYPSSQAKMQQYPTGRAYGMPAGSKATARDLVDMMESDDMATAWFAELRLRADAKAPLDLSFGMVGIKNDDGTSITWTNEIRGRVHRFDHVSFASFCEVHGYSATEFEFVRGVCFRADEESEEIFANDKKLESAVRVLYHQRQVAKKNKNKGLDSLCKLLLNASYGKLLLKWSVEKEKIIPARQLNSVLLADTGAVISASTITLEADESQRSWSVLTRTSLAKTWSRYALGALVLSHSRAIMNRVVAAAYHAETPLFYTDTDSIHILDADVKKLENEYERRYPGLPFDGDELGQFHGDIEDKKTKRSGTGVTAIYLDRKSYCIAAKVDGDDSERLFCKTAMKGITPAAMTLAAGGTEVGVFDLFKRHAVGEEISYDCRAGNKPMFVMSGKRSAAVFEIRKEAPVIRTLAFRAAA